MNKILMIDDDNEFISVFSELLITNDFVVDCIDNAKDGIEMAQSNNYDLIIIDLYLKKFTGFQVLELLREKNVNSKIIILTNSVDDVDESKALYLDIDEYLRKTTSFKIMIQRIKRVLSSATQINKGADVLRSDSERVIINIRERLVTKNNEVIHLSNLEFDLLCLFLQNKNVLLSRETILEKVWRLGENEVFIESRTVDVHVKNLRNKLNIKAIVTVRGMGYRWYEK
ncbi:two-component system response regulator RegX3 [Bacilli bacterium PM5-3]|nr:two-component system response regulator RegX3 [Bacilli bacterium PM5-3]MDH6603843.1 two-component system response regulator RegX3 [Bacilli bacterium PM5-9]